MMVPLTLLKNVSFGDVYFTRAEGAC